MKELKVLIDTVGIKPLLQFIIYNYLSCTTHTVLKVSTNYRASTLRHR